MILVVVSWWLIVLMIVRRHVAVVRLLIGCSVLIIATPVFTTSTLILHSVSMSQLLIGWSTATSPNRISTHHKVVASVPLILRTAILPVLRWALLHVLVSLLEEVIGLRLSLVAVLAHESWCLTVNITGLLVVHHLSSKISLIRRDLIRILTLHAKRITGRIEGLRRII